MIRGGPLSVADYMQEVLTNPSSGYYMKRDVFGSAGDFTTSPEISQMFGEMLGIWCVLLWQQLGQPRQLSLVELGPGRGTLMADLLRGTAAFTPFAQALQVHLVEVSPFMRQQQWDKLQCSAATDSGSSSSSSSAESSAAGEKCNSGLDAVQQQQQQKKAEGFSCGISALNGAPVRQWRGARLICVPQCIQMLAAERYYCTELAMLAAFNAAEVAQAHSLPMMFV